MSTATPRVVVDPITRIEGHLRIEAATDAEGRITQAYSAGTMVRGLEIILRGRDPRDAWAFAQRICGVCTLVHGIASVRAVEDALHYEIPPNANLVRNLMIGAQYVHDHVMHFYHLHALDWVDVVSALSADPAATSTLAQSLSGYARSSPGYFADVQQRVKTLVESGQLGIFAGAYWGHPAYKLPPDANLMAVAHYLDALAWQRDVATLHAIFGGKNPHPHLLVGGAPNPIDLESDSAINAKRLAQVQDIIVRMRQFVDEVYLPDTLAIAGFYKDWATQGEGLGNFLCFGDFPAKRIEPDREHYPHLPHAPMVIDGRHVKLEDLGAWGQRWSDGRITGFIDGKPVAEVRLSGNPLATTLQVQADDLELLADEKDATRVIVRALDQVGRLLPFLDDIATISVTGAAKLLGPDQLMFKGGLTGFWVETTGERGTITVTVTTRRLGSKTLVLNAA